MHSREEILDRIWGDAFLAASRSLDVRGGHPRQDRPLRTRAHRPQVRLPARRGR
ncbi:hypothetical protein [Streptomyces sp. MMS21 TC-5]|uniref:hypothetical protein n=1 Tax=Streptomyces sp. MMS21 TC-5 TaxID=2925833 RepID=UPI0035ADDF34